MSQLDSSTSNSEAPGDAGFDPGGIATPIAPRRDDRREALAVLAWMVAFLVAGDVAINRLFPLPLDPRVEPKGVLTNYFNHGWSIEAKLHRMVGPTDETSAPLTPVGWVDREVARPRPIPEGTPAERIVSIYGMSFTDDIGKAMGRLDPGLRVRMFSGPAAPANHSYALYERDRGGPSGVVIFGVVALCMQGMVANNGLTWRFEGPAPFHFPRYYATPSGLRAEWPSVRTLEDLRACLADPAAWEEYVSRLRSTDDFYNRFLFLHNWTDESVLIRLIRRAAAQKWYASRVARIHGPEGFNESAPFVPSVRAIIASFAATARRDGKRPIVLLIEDQGYEDHLSRILEPVLVRDAIPHFSTRTVCPNDDPRHFIADGHFTEEANERVARALMEFMRRELARPAERPASAGPAPR